MHLSTGDGQFSPSGDQQDYCRSQGGAFISFSAPAKSPRIFEEMMLIRVGADMEVSYMQLE